MDEAKLTEDWGGPIGPIFATQEEVQVTDLTFMPETL